jgi:hypothetical protein
MPAVEKISGAQAQELETSLQSLSARWRGDLQSYLEALARAKAAAAAEHDNEFCVKSALESVRFSRRR